MKLSNATPALFVKDINTSKSFYTDILGLTITLDFGKNITFKEGFAIWEIRENHIIPEKLGIKNISDKSVNRFELYFETENIQTIENQLKENEVDIIHSLHEEPWGQYTIRFFDLDNHLIEIGETLQSLVKRLKNNGLSLSEISKKTFIKLQDIKKFLDDN